MSNTPSDPIAEVCGVPAADILARVAERRTPLVVAAAPAPPPPPLAAPVAPPRPQHRWRLLDFGDGTRDEFIEAAHQAMLGRAAGDAEIALRLSQLARGRTRLGILTRLALSEEGRSLTAPPPAGLCLRGLRKLAPVIVALARLPILRAAQRKLRVRRR